MPDPMTDDQLAAIGVGGFSALTPVPALLAEVKRLRDGIAAHRIKMRTHKLDRNDGGQSIHEHLWALLGDADV